MGDTSRESTGGPTSLILRPSLAHEIDVRLCPRKFLVGLAAPTSMRLSFVVVGGVVNY